MIAIGSIRAKPAHVAPIDFITYANTALPIAFGIKRIRMPAGRPTTIIRASTCKKKALVLLKVHRPPMK
jgi:hypothetical protein